MDARYTFQNIRQIGRPRLFNIISGYHRHRCGSLIDRLLCTGSNNDFDLC